MVPCGVINTLRCAGFRAEKIFQNISQGVQVYTARREKTPPPVEALIDGSILSISRCFLVAWRNETVGVTLLLEAGRARKKGRKGRKRGAKSCVRFPGGAYPRQKFRTAIERGICEWLDLRLHYAIARHETPRGKKRDERRTRAGRVVLATGCITNEIKRIRV